MSFVIIRDPVWNNVRVDALAMELIDTSAFQRLRYVRQLGWVYMVYPGATHTRFEHAVGTYHLARRALALLEERGEAQALTPEDCQLARIAALLHDIGHYPYSHALEEIGALHHEEVARPLVTEGEVADLLVRRLGSEAPGRIMRLIRGESDSPLQGLISGSFDLDKLDYLRRDAFMCGVSYGEIDVDRLLQSLLLLREPSSRRAAVGLSEKALSALESLLFAKYQMYRNVYWHHAVRGATAMYKRLVADAINAGSLDARELAGFTDEGLLHRVAQRRPSPLLQALRMRRLYKRAFECPAADLPLDGGEWIADDRELTVAVEDALARELGLHPGELLVDYPAKTQMLGLDIPVLRRNGEIRQLTAEGWEGAIDLPRLSDQFYRSARWLRVFTCRRMALDRGRVIDLVRKPASEVRRLLSEGRPLLG
jgi:HD superfamily phosphohydrolase